MTLKLVLSPAGADCTMLLMAAALAGLRSVCPAPKVTRSPAPVAVAALAALSEIGGGGGGQPVARLAAVAAPAPGRRWPAVRSAAWPVAASLRRGVTAGCEPAMRWPPAVAVAGFSVACCGGGLRGLAAAVRLAPAVASASGLPDAWPQVWRLAAASSACRSTVTCACAGAAARAVP